jgi:hypothetical protein
MSVQTLLPMIRKIILAFMFAMAMITYGHFAHKNYWWIARQIFVLDVSFQLVLAEFKRPPYLSYPPAQIAYEQIDPDAVAPGLVLIAGIGEDREHFVRVIERDGTVVHEWRPNWFDIWPDTPTELPPARIPQKPPGAILHGVQVAPDGDLLLNYEFLSTVRLDTCGKTKWKQANSGHHSLNFASDGTIWVGSGQLYFDDSAGYENHPGPLDDWSLMQLTPDGKILKNKKIAEILLENNLQGLLHLSTLLNDDTSVRGDTLHANDVEPFPADMDSELFETGDLLVSLRNINTIFVVDPDTWQIKFISSGHSLRQHDPDFAPDDKILIYDNRNLNPYTDPDSRYSRIVEIDARTGLSSTRFRGEGRAHFYSPTMGRQQALPNGNIMIVSAEQGRAFEVDKTGRLIWQHYNIVSPEFTGLITEAHVLPLEYDRAFFETHRNRCQN